MTDQLGITVQMKVADGYVEYCCFSLAQGRQSSEQLFRHLKGIHERGIALPLRLNLISLSTTPREVIATKYCRLDELAWNSRFITREIFKHYNLE